jgi:hypothetical protein
MANDYQLDDDGDLKIEAGDFVFSDALTDDVAMIISINQGELKSDPLTGCNMVSRIRSQQSAEEIQRSVRLQLQRDGKNFNEIKDYLKTIINGGD